MYVNDNPKGGMLMNIFFRVLLAFYAFCLAVFSAFCMYIAIDPQAFVDISGTITGTILANEAGVLRVVVFIVALIFFVLSIIFLASGVRSNKDKKAVSKHTNIGEIKISLNSIENIAINASRRSNGIKETKTLVRKVDDGVEIEVRIIVMPDLSIPVISEEVQGRVKKAVEESSGISVKQVRVVVDSIYTGITTKPRVE
jgi:uncharacterized alkaline shock family protein YloU